MTVTQNLSTIQVTMEYCATWNSHHKCLAHLCMSNESKIKLATKDQQEVNIERIVDDTRDTFSPSGLRKEHLVARKKHPKHNGTEY